jgi:hypothetical protein
VARGLPGRNSLGDLKIPARISQAQVGLRRDLGMVRECSSTTATVSRQIPLVSTDSNSMHVGMHSSDATGRWQHSMELFIQLS